MKLIWKILIGFIIVASALGLIYLVYSEDKDINQKAQMLGNIDEQTRPIRVQIARIEAEINEKEKSIPIETPSLVDAFILQRVEEISLINEFATRYHFTPVVVLECSNNDDLANQLMEELKKMECEIALISTEWTSSTEKDIDRMVGLLQEYDLHANFFFLTEQEDTINKRKLLQKKGFLGIVRQNAELPGDVTEEGLPFISWFAGESEADIRKNGDWLIQDSNMVVAVFDLSNPNRELLSDLVDDMDDYVYFDNVKYVGLMEPMQELLDNAGAVKVDYQKEFEQYKEEREKEIKELQEELEKIESQLSDAID